MPHYHINVMGEKVKHIKFTLSVRSISYGVLHDPIGQCPTRDVSYRRLVLWKTHICQSVHLSYRQRPHGWPTSYAVATATVTSQKNALSLGVVSSGKLIAMIKRLQETGTVHHAATTITLKS